MKILLFQVHYIIQTFTELASKTENVKQAYLPYAKLPIAIQNNIHTDPKKAIGFFVMSFWPTIKYVYFKAIIEL